MKRLLILACLLPLSGCYVGPADPYYVDTYSYGRHYRHDYGYYHGPAYGHGYGRDGGGPPPRYYYHRY